MKKILLSVFALFAFALVSMAQEQGQFRASLGLAGGSKAAVDFEDGDAKFGLGIDLGVEYFVTDQISIAPSYTYFFNSSDDVPTGFGTTEEFSVKPRVFNLDGRYYFGDDISFYALAGLAFQSVTAEFGDFESDGSATTFNLGGGINLPLSDMLGFYGQVKLMGGDDTETFDGTQIVIGAGVTYSFN